MLQKFVLCYDAGSVSPLLPSGVKGIDRSLGITVLAFNTVRGTLLRGPHDSCPRGPSGVCKRAIQ